jgi:hypothetical protein
MVLFQLIYMSTLSRESSEVLPAILESSVRNNKHRGITGMILCAEGRILQVLEGGKGAVLKTFRAIESDVRHSDIFVLIEQEIVSRQFASWSMGFRQLTKAELKELPTSVPIFSAQQDEISLRVRSGAALTILKSFADGSMGLT